MSTENKTIGQKILDDITDRIHKGEWERGKLMPSELALSKEYGVSRSTVHWAMVKLHSDGMIVRVPGKGSAVSYEPHQTDIKQPGGIRRQFFREDWAQGFRLISFEEVNCPDFLTGVFGCETDDRALYIIRQYYDETGRPTGAHYSWVAPGYVKYVDTGALDRLTIAEQFEAAGVKVDRYEEFLSASSASKEDAGYLKIRMGSPVLIMEENRYLENGRGVYHMRIVNRADAIKLRFESRA